MFYCDQDERQTISKIFKNTSLLSHTSMLMVSCNIRIVLYVAFNTGMSHILCNLNISCTLQYNAP